MKKKLVDLTIEELNKICNSHHCIDCPCLVYGGYDSVCWKSLVEDGIKDIEVEVLDNENKRRNQ